MGTLQLLDVSTKSKKVQVFPNRSAGSLLSLGTLCDYGCTTTINKEVIKVGKLQQIIMKVTQKYINGVWELSLDTTLSPIIGGQVIEMVNYQMA